MLHVLYIIINISCPRKRIKIGECHATSYGSLKFWCKLEIPFCQIYFLPEEGVPEADINVVKFLLFWAV